MTMADFVYVNPKYEDHLRKEGLLDLRRLLDWSEGDCVGVHGPREIWRITLPGLVGGDVFYLRKDRRVPVSAVVRDLLTGGRPMSRCRKAFHAAGWLARANIDTMHAVCLIERRRLGWPRKAVSIVTAVPGRDLYELLRSYGRPNQRLDNPRPRRALLYELGRLIWRLHQARLAWPDVLAKHIYVRHAQTTDPRASPWEFALIDVENMTRRFRRRTRQREMDQLLFSLRGLVTATDVLRIMLGYIGMESVRVRSVRRRLLAKFFPTGLAWIVRARRERALLRGFPTDRPLAEEELYERINAVTVNMRFRGRLAGLDLLRRDAMLTFTAGSELHKPGLKRRYRYRFEILDKDGTRTWLYLKRTRRPRLRDQLSRIASGTLWHSGSWHERALIKQLSLLRIPVPVVVAYGEKMVLGWERCSVLITEGIVGQTLERFVPKHFARSAGTDELHQRRRWIRQLGNLIRRFHQAGYCHRDLYLSHIVISFGRNGEPIFHLIDLGRCFKMHVRRKRWIVKDLAALNYSAGPGISRSDRLRFLLTYLALNRLTGDSKALTRKIVSKSRRIAGHDRKHARRTVERPYANRTGN